MVSSAIRGARCRTCWTSSSACSPPARSTARSSTWRREGSTRGRRQTCERTCLVGSQRESADHVRAWMAVVLFNPNSSTLITEAMADHVRRVLGGDGWYAVTNSGAPEVLSSVADFELAERSMLTSLSSRPFQAIVVGAFADPGLDVLKSTGAPVIGLGSTTLFAAASYRSFGVVTPAKVHP